MKHPTLFHILQWVAINLAIGAVVASTCLGAYWRFGPVQKMFTTQEAYPLKTNLRPGEDLLVKRKFSVNVDGFVTVQREVRCTNSISRTIVLPDISRNFYVGTYDAVFVVSLPVIAHGRCEYHVTSTYHVNPLRTVVEKAPVISFTINERSIPR